MNATGDPASQARLIAALTDPAVFGPGCERVRHLETHISHVLLTGAHAYKIKKPVDLGFLDFTTLAQRKFYCEQELRLNRRLAPAIYLDVVAITGSVDRPAIGGDGPVVEYAVKMREFAQEALASRMLAAGSLGAAHVDALAAEVAAFHGRVETAGEGTRFGSPDTILRVALQNFDSIRPLRDDPADRERQDGLRAWTEREHALRLATFERRKADGFVRECHGDLHLNNIAVIDDEVTVFDCIEFNDELRWIDVMSEIAFTTMDLADRGRPDLAHRFVNAYLESTGDYAGLAVFPFYLVYRAMVRAKIACLRLGQLEPGDERTALVAEYRGYVDLATHYARAPHPAFVVTHGLSGSGKTTLTQGLLEWIGAIRIRTDVERKRLHGLDARARSGSGLDEGLYAADATERTYRRALAARRSGRGGGRRRDRRRHVPQALAARSLPCPRGRTRAPVRDPGVHRERRDAAGAHRGACAARHRRVRGRPRRARRPAAHARAARARRTGARGGHRCRGAAGALARPRHLARGLRPAGHHGDAAAVTLRAKRLSLESLCIRPRRKCGKVDADQNGVSGTTILRNPRNFCHATECRAAR